MREEALGDRGIAECELQVGPDLSGPGALCGEIHQALSAAGAVQRLSLWFQLSRLGDERETLGLLPERDPLR